MHALDLRQDARQHMPAVSVSPSLRSAAIGTWKGRMVNEYTSARVFVALADQLADAGVADEAVRRCRSFARQERMHGVLCGAVVEAFGGEATASVGELAPVPEHADVDRLEAALRNLIHISCMSETVAVALIGAERLEMPDGPLRELLTTIYADECAHCNFGWRLLPELLGDDEALRERLSRYLPVAFAHLEAHELAHLPLGSRPPAEGARVGMCSGSDARVLFYETVERVIVPGLDALGLRASDAWRGRSLSWSDSSALPQ